jgi:hypothetical protein
VCVRVWASTLYCVNLKKNETRDMHVLKKHLRILVENSVGHSTYASWVKYTSYRQLLISKV